MWIDLALEAGEDGSPGRVGLVGAGHWLRPALEALAEYLPLVVIELRAWRGEAEVILVPETVVINQGLDVAGPAGTVSARLTGRDVKRSATSAPGGAPLVFPIQKHYSFHHGN